MVLTSIVFPLPGGPNNSNPRAGALSPVNNWKYDRINLCCATSYKLAI